MAEGAVDISSARKGAEANSPEGARIVQDGCCCGGRRVTLNRNANSSKKHSVDPEEQGGKAFNREDAGKEKGEAGASPTKGYCLVVLGFCVMMCGCPSAVVVFGPCMQGDAG